jgi:TRAP-type uncharacterized transport system substrate-binding protein
MSRRLKYLRIAQSWTVITVGVAALAGAWVVAHRDAAPPIRTLRLTAGSFHGERTRVAEALRHEAGRHGLILDLVETEGSEDALERLADPASGLDLALVQGGLRLDDGHEERLRQVTALHDEPLHLLVRGPELLGQVRARGLPALRGRSVDLGMVGSGTHRLASEVLDFAGLGPRDYQAVALAYDELQELDSAELPEAVFMVSTIPSEVAEHLVVEHDYRLAPIPYAHAFAIWRPGRMEGHAEIVRRDVREVAIPAMTYDRDPPVPEDPVVTLGTRMLLVAREGLDAEAVERVLTVVFESPFAHVDMPPLDPSLLRSRPEIPWHEGALRYMKRNAPLIAGDVLDLAEKEVSIIAAALGGLFCVVQWLRQRFRRMRDRSFQGYILKVHDVDRRAQEREAAASLDLPALLELQQELIALRSEAISRFGAGEIEGEELMAGFLTLVNDARDHLTRLVLHARDTIEALAAQEGRSAEAVWTEAVAAAPSPEPQPPAEAAGAAAAGESAGIGPRHSIL